MDKLNVYFTDPVTKEIYISSPDVDNTLDLIMIFLLGGFSTVLIALVGLCCT